MKEDAKLSVLRSCVKVEVAVLGSPSLISLMVSVDVKHHERITTVSFPCEHAYVRVCVRVFCLVLGCAVRCVQACNM